MARDEVYVSTDIETDGPVPGLHSMLSLGSAAYRVDKTCLDTIEQHIQTLPEASPDPLTMLWWADKSEAWAYCRGEPVFVGYSAAWDFAFGAPRSVWVEWMKSPITYTRLC